MNAPEVFGGGMRGSDAIGGSLPHPLAALSEHRWAALRMLEELERAEDGVVRADLASEIIRHLSRYENAKDEVLDPVLRNEIGETRELDEAMALAQALRAAMREIEGRTRHVKPMNAHADDPEGMKRAIDTLLVAAWAVLDHDERAILPLALWLAESAQEEPSVRLLGGWC